MSSGTARIAEPSTIRALRRRKSHAGPVPAGVMGALTAVCWAAWIYLVLPLASLLLWVGGVQLFVRQSAVGGYREVGQTLLSYSSVLLILVGLLAIWIFWNVARYSGQLDRRTVKRAEVTDLEVWKRFRLDASIGAPLRRARAIRVDLDHDGCVMVIVDPPAVGSAAGADRGVRVAGEQPGQEAVVDDGADAVRPRVGEVEEVVEVA